MIVKNYLNTALRNFTKRKLYSFINAFGLSIAIAFCSLVYLFINDELSFDKFHSKRDRVYRINDRSFNNFKFDQGEKDYYQYHAFSSNALGTALREEAPEVDHVTQLKRSSKQTIRFHEKIFAQEIMFADSGFFNIFSFELLNGSYHQLFKQPTDAVITPEVAKKIFGDADPIGKTFYLDYEQSIAPAYTVKAVVKCPANSSILFEVLLPLESYKPFLKKVWNVNSYHTFVLLNPQATPAQFKVTLDTLLAKNRGDWMKAYRSDNNLPADMLVEEYTLTQLGDVHFDKKVSWINVSDPKYSWILGSISLLIILIASINYVSFALTSSANRIKEIAIRKTAGASRRQIFQQFNLESFGLVCIATFIGVGLTLSRCLFLMYLHKKISLFSRSISSTLPHSLFF